MEEFRDYYNRREQTKEELPAWRLPLSKSFTATLRKSQEREVEAMEDVESVIQILLPCMICNRTFSPEALERHANICTKVNAQADKGHKPYDSSFHRIKDTKLESFIPPPILYENYEPPSPFFRRDSTRRSFNNGRVTPSPVINNKNLNGSFRSRGSRGASTDKESLLESTNNKKNIDKLEPKRHFFPSEDKDSEFGSNSEESGVDVTTPSYARALSPSEDCPFCGRNFILKAFDRHLKFCQEIHERKLYEVQPTPKEKEEAKERQEIRTKYKPLKGSTSCTSLRSVSPGKDLTSAALKFFNGLGKRSDPSNTTSPSFSSFTKNGLSRSSFKKSNDSLVSQSASCYGDFSRGRSSALSRQNSLLSRSSFRYQSLTPQNHKAMPMRLNTSNNINKNSSNDSLNLGMNNPFVSNYAHVNSSGYGQGLTRNSKTRSSLHKNFFRTKRVEPEGTENTSNTSHLISPMNFYRKGNQGTYNDSQMNEDQDRKQRNNNNNGFFDPSYDPYEKAAEQFEKLLQAQPTKRPNGLVKNTMRKMGLDRALQSVNSSLFGKKDEDGRNNFLGSNTGNESYWDTILPKREPNMTTTNENKSRAVSNVSSADSAFSRSDGTDLEFEALESLVNLGDVPEEKEKASPPRLLEITEEGSIEPKDSSFTRNKDGEKTEVIRRSPLERLRASFNNKNHNGTQIPTRVQTSHHANLFSSTNLNHRNNNGSDSSNYKMNSNFDTAIPPSRFCHECGTAYPTVLAKFCPECGEKRAIVV